MAKKLAKPTLVKTKKRCCKSGPRCKKCPVVCKRLAKEGLATRVDDRHYELAVTLRKKDLKTARAR